MACPHTVVVKTMGKNADGPYRGMAFEMWACSECGHDFFPRHHSRFHIWRQARKLRRGLRGWDAEA